MSGDLHVAVDGLELVVCVGGAGVVARDDDFVEDCGGVEAESGPDGGGDVLGVVDDVSEVEVRVEDFGGGVFLDSDCCSRGDGEDAEERQEQGGFVSGWGAARLGSPGRTSNLLEGGRSGHRMAAEAFFLRGGRAAMIGC